MRSICFGIIVACAIFAGCSKSTQTTQTAAGTVSASAQPSAAGTPTPAPTTAASLTAPAGWNLVTSPPAGTLAQWVRPGNEANVQNITLTGEPFSGTLDAFVAEEAKTEQNLLPGISQLSSQDVIICGSHAARLVKWTLTRNGTDFEFEQLYTIWDKTGPTGYVATYTRAVADQELPEATTALQSLCAL